MTQTIGEWIEKQVADYIQLAKDIEENPIAGCTARGIIEGEIALRRYQWEQVSLKVWEHFEEQDRRGA